MPANQIPLVNGKAYAWANVSIMLAGAPVIGVSAINYDDTEEKEDNYGSGKFPIERAEGNYKASVDVTLRASELEAIADKAANGRLQDFGVFDIVVEFLVGTVVKTHKIRNCEFTGNKRDMKQGDKTIEASPGLICSHIEWK
jgi:hypothetical protein